MEFEGKLKGKVALIGKAVVALACDKRIMRKSGQALVSGKLARDYGFTDIDGTQPIWHYGM